MPIMRFITFLPILFVFMPAFVLFIGKNKFIHYPVIFVPIVLAILLLLNYRYIIKTVVFLCKYTPYKYLLLLYIWIIISGFFAVVFGYFSLAKFLLMITYTVVLKVLFIYIYPAFVIPKFISLRRMIRFFCIGMFVLYILGIVDFASSVLHIDIIKNILDFFANRQIRFDNIEEHSGLPRARGICMEPGWFARLITINLPIAYYLCKSKYKIFRNKFFNIGYKWLLIPLSWVCIILTQSPIFVIFAFVTTIFVFLKEIVHFILRHYKTVIFLLLTVTTIIFLLIENVNLGSTFLSRITNVLEIIVNFDIYDFINIEPSLATRVVNNINQYQIFLKHKLFGIGLTNSGPILVNQMINTPVPLTPEMYNKLLKSTNTIALTSNAMYTLLFQTGLPGFILYSFFMVKTINIIDKVKKYYCGILYDFVHGLKGSIVVMFVLSIVYEQDFIDTTLFFYTGLVCPVIYIAMMGKSQLIPKKNNKD